MACASSPGLQGATGQDSHVSGLKLSSGNYADGVAFWYVSLVGPAVDGAAQWALKHTWKTPENHTGEIPVDHTGRIPEDYKLNREARDGKHHHITLVTPPEIDELWQKTHKEAGCRQTKEHFAREVFRRVVEEVGASGGSWLPLGLGRAACGDTGSEALFLPVAWPAGRSARAALGLDAKREQHFHITLGFRVADVHTKPKDLSSLVGGRVSEELLTSLALAAQAARPAGAELPRHLQAAVLVLQGFRELDRAARLPEAPQQTQLQAGPPVAAEVSREAHGSAPLPTPAVLPDTRTTASAARGCAGSLLSIAREWAPEPATAGPSAAEGLEELQAGESAAAVAWLERRFVAACAHVAFARLPAEPGSGGGGAGNEAERTVSVAETEAGEAVVEDTRAHLRRAVALAEEVALVAPTVQPVRQQQQQQTGQERRREAAVLSRGLAEAAVAVAECARGWAAGGNEGLAAAAAAAIQKAARAVE